MVHIHVLDDPYPAQSAATILSQIAMALVASSQRCPEVEPPPRLSDPPMNWTSSDQPQENTLSQHAPENGTCPPCLIPVRYHDQQYPPHIAAPLIEVPANFESTQVPPVHGPYSLHTEYASTQVDLSLPRLEGFEVLRNSHRRGVPELWTSEAWAEEFAQFVIRLAEPSEPPTIIEVHPPFKVNVGTLPQFLEWYAPFERAILDKYPNCRIVVENRRGNKLSRRFVVSDLASLLTLGLALDDRNLRLGIALDLPALFTAEYGGKTAVGMEGAELVKKLRPIAKHIETIHLWGRGPNGGAHFGTLDNLFDPRTDAKRACLHALSHLLSDGLKRFLVVEVAKGGGRLESILFDLEQAGFTFGQI